MASRRRREPIDFEWPRVDRRARERDTRNDSSVEFALDRRSAWLHREADAGLGARPSVTHSRFIRMPPGSFAEFRAGSRFATRMKSFPIRSLRIILRAARPPSARISFATRCRRRGWATGSISISISSGRSTSRTTMSSGGSTVLDKRRGFAAPRELRHGSGALRDPANELAAAFLRAQKDGDLLLEEADRRRHAAGELPVGHIRTDVPDLSGEEVRRGATGQEKLRVLSGHPSQLEIALRPAGARQSRS